MLEWGNTLIALLAAFGGAFLTSKLQRRASREQRAEDQRRAEESDAKQLVARMMTALDDHRSAMVTSEGNRHENGGKYDSADVRRTHETRCAISGLVTLLGFVNDELGAKAEAAADTAYAMYRSDDLKDLERHRLAALREAREFRSWAVARFRAAGASFVLPGTGQYASLPSEAR